MATIKDIARETGLSLATISKYLNGGHVLDKNRAAIEEAVSRLGFTVNEFARGLKTSRSHTIGVIIPELGNIFITSIVTVMEDILRKSGYAVIICDCGSDPGEEERAVRFLLGKSVDGIVNMPASGSGAHLRPALEKNIPVVLIDRMLPDVKDAVNAVLVDNIGAAATATRELVEAGHRDIGIILGPRDIFTSQQRLFGYHQALIENALLPDPRLTVFSDYSVQGGYESVKRLLGDAAPTAVFVTNYEMTLGAMIALNELGVAIPGQLSVIGFDNLELSRVILPRLTIVTQPLEEIGASVAAILLERLDSHADGEKPVRTVTLSTGIQPGDSVKQMDRQ